MRIIKWWGIGIVLMAILGFVNELKPTPYPLPEMWIATAKEHGAIE